MRITLPDGLQFEAASWLSWALAVGLLVVLAVAVVAWLARRRAWNDGGIASADLWTLGLSALLRSLAVAAVLAALADARLVETVHEDRLAVVALLDDSASIRADETAWMESRLEQIVSELHGDDSLAVLRFGADAAVALPLGPPDRTPGRETTTDRQATNIMAAIDAVSAIGANSPPVVVLLSDGNQTRGDAVAAAKVAARRGLRIFPFAPSREHAALRLERVRAPGAIRHGEDAHFPVALANSSTTPIGAVLVAREFDRELGRIPVEVPPGRSVIDVSLPVEAPGHYRIDFSLESTDGRRLGPAEPARLSVLGRPRVLVVGTRQSLARALEAAGFEVKATPRLEVETADQLEAFHAVVIAEATAADLPVSAQQALADFVLERGGGLLLASARGLVTDKKLEDSPLAGILPVGIREEKPEPRQRAPFALVLVIDRSSSMTYGITLEQKEPARIAYARKAALTVVDQLEDRDLVGVIAFDTVTTELAPLAPLGPSRAQVEDVISRLVPSGGTDFKEALEIAAGRLNAVDNPIKHILLLSDGASIRPVAEHEEVIEALRRGGVTVTSIRIGDDKDSFALVQDIAERTNGVFHHVKDADSLPDLMAEDARRHAGREEEEAEPPFRPKLARTSGALAGFEAEPLPILRAFADVPLREGAEVWMEREGSESRQPILAAWQNGLGRVAVFTANAGEDWQGWRHAQRFWAQLVRWVARPRSDDEVVLRLEQSEGQPRLEIRTFDHAPGGETLRVAVQRLDGTEIVLTALPVAPDRYEAALPPLDEIEPRVRIARRRSGATGPAATQGSTTPGSAAREGQIPAATPGSAKKGSPPNEGQVPVAARPAARPDGATGPSDAEAGTEIAWSREDWLPRAAGLPAVTSEDPAAPPDRLLLERIAESTGGALDAPLSTVLARAPAERERSDPMLPWLTWLALVATAADIVLRQTRRLN